jgi:putative holliday junction resolvase
LALDVGSKRIGVAVSDELRVLARGLETLRRESRRKDIEAIAALAREYGVTELLVGHPVRLGGENSAQTDKVEIFTAELRQHVDVPVRLWDERLTSVEAAERLGPKRSAKEHIAQRKSGAVDRMAAVLILQSYLDISK